MANFNSGGCTLIDYEYKARLLAEGLPDLEKQVSVSFWRHYSHTENKNTWPSWLAEQVQESMYSERPKDWIECKKINHAEFARSVRLYHRIEDYISSSEGGSLFLTLTFSDETLAKTSAKTRRTYVCRFLKECGARYVANVDYGSEKGREHYHAVVSAPKIDYKPWHDYGAIKGEKIRVKDNTCKNLGKYVAKLSNHAIKATTRRCSIIYSR